jgi:hypothetical protein
VVLIENSPANLAPRAETDAQSERIDGLLFDGLVAQENQPFSSAVKGASGQAKLPFTGASVNRKGQTYTERQSP